MGSSLSCSAHTGTYCKVWPAHGVHVASLLVTVGLQLSGNCQIPHQVLTQSTAHPVSHLLVPVTHTVQQSWHRAPHWSHMQAGSRGKVRPAQVRYFDTARIHVQAGAGGRGSVAFRREANVPRGRSFWT